MSVENVMELLWNCAKSLPSDRHTHKLLKSYYINTCRKLSRNCLQIPKAKFAISQMCAFCGSLWSDNEYRLKLIPKQIKIKSKVKKLIELWERTKDDSTSKVLNKRQRNRAKWLQKKISNHLAINCYQCKRSSLVKMENVKSKSRKNQLNTQSKENCMIGPETVSKENHKKQSNDGCNFNKSQVNKNASTSSKIKKNKQIEKSTTIQGSKSKEKLTVPSKKVTSQTQKNNSLLQLAVLLQKKTKSDLKNSAQKKLDSFLK